MLGGGNCRSTMYRREEIEARGDRRQRRGQTTVGREDGRDRPRQWVTRTAERGTSCLGARTTGAGGRRSRGEDRWRDPRVRTPRGARGPVARPERKDGGARGRWGVGNLGSLPTM
jgi:hypothetical protein